MSKKKRDYDEVSVVRDLNKKKSCMVNANTISIGDNHSDLGNTSWGKIDYLIKVHGYTLSKDENVSHRTHVHSRQNQFTQGKVKIKDNSVKSSKFNLAAIVQSAMNIKS